MAFQMTRNRWFFVAAVIIAIIAAVFLYNRTRGTGEKIGAEFEKAKGLPLEQERKELDQEREQLREEREEWEAGKSKTSPAQTTSPGSGFQDSLKRIKAEIKAAREKAIGDQAYLGEEMDKMLSGIERIEREAKKSPESVQLGLLVDEVKGIRRELAEIRQIQSRAIQEPRTEETKKKRTWADVAREEFSWEDCGSCDD